MTDIIFFSRKTAKSYRSYLTNDSTNEHTVYEYFHNSQWYDYNDKVHVHKHLILP